MSKIYERDAWYSFLRPFVDHLVQTSFHSVTVTGESNIPDDGAVMLAPNHCNTLMDALVVLQCHKEPVVFGARADIFKKPLAARLLRFLKILPIPRLRDNIRQVAKNRETMAEAVESLENGVKYCMFCEGTHRTRHSLLPLRKGIIRTALLANDKFGEKKPVYIVPMGIEYGDYFRFRTSVKVSYGEAINVTEFLKANPEMLESEVYRTLLDELKSRLSSLFTYLPDDDRYEARWTLAKISDSESAMKADDTLMDKAVVFEQHRKEQKISIKSLGHRRPLLRTLLKLLIALIVLPVCLFCTIVSSPMWIASSFICKSIKDPAFANTARFCVKFAILPFITIVWAVAAFCLLPFKWALPAFVVALFSHSTHYEFQEYLRVLLSDIRLLSGHQDLKEEYEELVSCIKK